MAGRDYSEELFGAGPGRDFSSELFGGEPAEKPGAFVSGFKSYLPQLQETFGGIKTLAGVAAERAIGEGDISKGLIESGRASMAEAQAAQQGLATAERGSFSDALAKGVGSVLTEWLPYQAGSGAANILEALAVTGAGALAGTAAAPGAGTAIGAGTGLVARELAKRGIKEAAEQVIKEQGEEAAKDFFAKEASKVAAEIGAKYAARGQAAALGTQAGFYGAGQTTSRAVEEAQAQGGTASDIELGRVLPAAAVSGVAEFISDKIGLGALKGMDAPGKSLVMNIAKSIALAGTKEAPTEVIQAVAERYGAKLSLDDAAALKEYIDSAAAAYAMSVAPGAVGGARGTMQYRAEEAAKPEVETIPPDASLEEPQSQLTPEQIQELAQQQAASERPRTTEELLAEVPLQTGKPTTTLDIDRIRDEHETAVIEGLLAQDFEMTRANEIAAQQRELDRQRLEGLSEAETTIGGISDVDRRVREGRIFSRVQDLINQDIPFASTAISDINQKFGLINEAPLTDDERARVQNIMGMTQVFTDFVKLPKLAPKPVDQFAENRAMEALIKERGERGQAQPLRTAPAAPSPIIQETPVSQGVGEGETIRPPSGIQPSVAEDRELVTPPVIKTTAPVMEAPAPAVAAAPVAPPPSQKQVPQSDLSGTAVGGAPIVSAQEAAPPAPKPQPTTGDVASKKFPKTVMGSTLLAAVNRRLGGLDPSLISEFSTRFETARIGRNGKPIVQYRNPLTPDGKLFRTGGTLDFQLIAEALEDEGYLPSGSVAADYKEAGERAKQLINAALNRQEVEKEEDSAEQMLARRAEMEQMDAEELAAAQEAQDEGLYPGLDEESIIEAEREREAIIAESDIDMTVLTDDDINFFGEIAPQSDEEYAESLRRGLGLNDEEVANEIKARAAARSAEEDGRARAREAKEAGAAREAAQGITSYTPEEVTRKQESQEEAAAAEKKSKAAEQERLRKEQQSKEEKVRADESVKDFELGKTAEEQMTGMGDLFAEQPKREARQGTQKQLEEIDGHAKDVGGTVVYQDGEMALVRGFSLLTGQPVYIAVHGGYRARVDIESYTGNLVTPAQKTELVKVKQELEAEDKAKFDKAPSIKFVDGFAKSSNVSAEIAGVVRGWKELLGLKPNLYVTTIDDAVADRNKFTGPQRAIGSAGLDEREAGVVRRLPDGSYYIAFKKNTSKTKMLEVLAHELGHMHEREVFNNADVETKNKIRAEHDKWLASQKGKTARELIQSLRAKTSGKTTRVEKGLPADQLTPYWKSFGEWYADQVSRWAVTSEKPVGVVEQFFSRLAQALRSFYSKIKNAGYLPNETFAQYLEKVVVSTDVVSTDDDFSQQMLSEAKGVAGKATAKAQQLLQKQKVPTTGLSHVPEELIALAQPIYFPQNKTVLDRIDGMKDKFWQRVAQGVADQYRTIKEYSPVAYMQARISKSIDGALEGLMLHGHVFNDGGALNIRANTKGMLKVLEPVGKELDSYLMWVALNREFNLPEPKRSKAPNMDKLIANRAKFSAGELNGKSRLAVYESVAKEMNAINKSVLDVALQNGLINEQGYKDFSSNVYYIPFYRRMEGGDLEAVQGNSGLTSQDFSEELKGGEAPFGDLMENILRNWSHILSASMKNQAATTTLEAAMKQNAAVPNLKPGFEWKDGKVYSTQNGKLYPEEKDEKGKVIYKEGELRPSVTKSEAGMAKIVKDGQVMYFKVTEPLLMEAISSIGYLGPKSKFLDVARDFKNLLQFGVTLSPTFKVNNLIRDSVAAMGVSELAKDPISNIRQGISLSDPNSRTYISALAGGAIFNFGSAYEGDQAKMIKRLLDKGVSRNTILDSDNLISKGLRVTWDKYQEWGNKSEAANRLALYKQMTDKDMSHLEASFMARDLLDFSMQGSWPAFRMVTQVVPFMNARIQGLYKLGRDGIIPTYRVLYNTATGKELNEEEKDQQKKDKLKAQAFLTVTAAVGLASAVLYLAFKDDEDFKKRDQWDRDNFWWFKLPGMDVAYRVPKPFEIGAFGTLVERTLEQIFDSGAEGKQFTDSLSRTLWDTFAMNPTPQMIKPLLDIYANKDSFTGAPIESAGLERLSKQERKIDTTSPIAVALGGVSSLFPEKYQLSPVQMDYMIKGYLGWLGGTAAVTSTYAVAPFREGEYPDARWLDRLSLGLAKELPTAQSKYVTAFYDSNKEISQAFADMRHYAEAGDSEKVQRILEERGDKIALAKFYDKTAKSMASVRQQINIVTKDATMGGAEKKMEIDRLKQIISTLAQQAEEVRKSMKQ